MALWAGRVPATIEWGTSESEGGEGESRAERMFDRRLHATAITTSR